MVITLHVIGFYGTFLMAINGILDWISWDIIGFHGISWDFMGFKWFLIAINGYDI